MALVYQSNVYRHAKDVVTSKIGSSWLVLGFKKERGASPTLILLKSVTYKEMCWFTTLKSWQAESWLEKNV